MGPADLNIQLQDGSTFSFDQSEYSIPLATVIGSRMGMWLRLVQWDLVPGSYSNNIKMAGFFPLELLNWGDINLKLPVPTPNPPLGRAFLKVKAMKYKRQSPDGIIWAPGFICTWRIEMLYVKNLGLQFRGVQCLSQQLRTKYGEICLKHSQCSEAAPRWKHRETTISWGVGSRTGVGWGWSDEGQQSNHHSGHLCLDVLHQHPCLAATPPIILTPWWHLFQISLQQWKSYLFLPFHWASVYTEGA